MGAWGYDLFDNDAAGDLEVVWESYVARGRQVDPEHWTGERIHDFFRLYFRAAFSSGSWLEHGQAPLEVLALGGLFLKNGIPIPDDLRARLAEAANHELRRDRLKDWASPRRREQALVQFLETIGGERVPEAASADPVREEVRRWREFAKQYPRWIRLVKERNGGDEEANRVWPRAFFDHMGAAVGRGARVNDWKLCNSVYQYRLMAVAFLLGWWLDLPEEQTMSLVEAAKRTGGDVSAIHYLGTAPD